MATDLQVSNLPAMSPAQIIDALSTQYSNAARMDNCDKGTGAGLSALPSVMLWGPPGVGKSQLVHQIAARIETQTGKRVVVTDVRLLLFNPIDLRGIPTANADKTAAIWLAPEIFKMDSSADVINILFLDEISSAPQSVQAAAYQLTLDKKVGEHKLPQNCLVIAAGNRVTDKSVAYKMPRALANRLMHFEVVADFDGWKQWAISAAIDQRVVGFLDFRQDLLVDKTNNADTLAFPTPRSWELVSNVLKASGVAPGGDIALALPMISGLVGVNVASEFLTWCNVYNTLPNIEDIFMGKCTRVPTRTDALYALCAAMTTFAHDHWDDLNAKRMLANSIRYAETLPPDYAVIVLRDYMYIKPGARQELMQIPEFVSAINKRGAMLNGNI